jgi:hypothetical protein
LEDALNQGIKYLACLTGEDYISTGGITDKRQLELAEKIVLGKRYLE